jgi:hypothetical protein
MSVSQHEQRDEKRDERRDEESRDALAYEENWYRVLKALSLGEAIELGEVPDAEIAEVTFDPEVILRIA